jgi:SP family general alpha glucoside:H+ symporter-like MFS transporter
VSVTNALPRGVFQTITPSYAAEVVPMDLRPYLTSYVNLCWVGTRMLGVIPVN